MPRFFTKKEIMQKDCSKEDEGGSLYLLCTYADTIWTCEEMSPEWWNPSVTVICCELLKRLSDWLNERTFPNYFIRNANLFHETSSLAILEKTKKRLSDYVDRGTL